MHRQKKKRLAIAFGVCLFVLVPAAFFVESRLRRPGLPIEIVNVGNDPLADLTVEYPGGSVHADRFLPGAKLRARAVSSGGSKKLSVSYAIEYKGRRISGPTIGTELSEKNFASGDTLIVELTRKNLRMSSRSFWWKRIWIQVRDRIGF